MVFSPGAVAQNRNRQNPEARSAGAILEGQSGAGSRLNIFFVFLRLGCYCFGGPVAHLGYFREELVQRRCWLSQEKFTELIALTQLLPGPSSSQTSYLIGLLRSGVPGGFAAWLGFTLPSAVLMMLFAAGVQHARGRLLSGAMHGLQVAAIAVVAQAVVRMFRLLCPDWIRAAIASCAAVLATWAGGPVAQIAAIAAGGAAGWIALRSQAETAGSESGFPISRKVSLIAFSVFVFLFAGLEAAGRNGGDGAQLIRAFYRTGALVFGGGHVVLPLLEQAVVRPGWVGQNEFLSGYGAAQAIPGPLFTFAAYLGFVSRVHPNGIPGALLCLLAIFLPGLLLATAAAPFWEELRHLRKARALIGGVNAAVVGLLIAALLHAAFSGALLDWTDAMIAGTGFVLLATTRVSPVAVVLGTAALSSLRAVIA